MGLRLSGWLLPHPSAISLPTKMFTKLSVLCVSASSAAAAVDPGFTWGDVENRNAVSGAHEKDPGVWVSGTVDSMQACMDACAANSTCKSCDWAGAEATYHGGTCGTPKACFFRADDIWDLADNRFCNHTAVRKIPKPDPPHPPLGYQPHIVFFLQVPRYSCTRSLC